MASDQDSATASVQSASVILPAGDSDSGGDFELVRSQGSKTVVLVGDVEGNGLDVAPYADRLREEAERSLASADPVAVLESLNTYVYRDARFDRFVTACVVVIDREYWSAQWAFAGHLPRTGWTPACLWTGRPPAFLSG